MNTLLGHKIHQSIRGVVYLCDYTGNELIIRYQGLFGNPYDALQAYSNIMNPASQIAFGNTQEDFEKKLLDLHKNMENAEWVKSLADYL